MGTRIELHRICKSYANQAALRDITLQIEDTELIVFIGPSGSGKSTLLRTIAGFEKPTSGDILMGGVRVNQTRPSQRNIAMVFQNYALYPHMTARENMSYALRNLKTPPLEIKKRVLEVAKTLQIEALLDRKPDEMSGGQRQRIAIGRAIIRNPKAFLLDEPLSNLDASLRAEMRIQISQIHERLDAPMIYVTHDQVEAMTLADRIVLMNAGKIEQVGSPIELYFAPRNQFVAQFLGSPSMNLISGTLIAAEANRALIQLPNRTKLPVAADARTFALHSSFTLGIRPEHLVIGHRSLSPQTSEIGKLEAIVQLVENLGNRRLYYLVLLSEDSKAPIPMIVEQWAAAHEKSPSFQKNEIVSLHFQPANAVLFDGAGNALPQIKSFERVHFDKAKKWSA